MGMTTEVEILIIEIPRIIETDSIVAIVEIPETGLTEVTVGIDFILETMIIETITRKATTEAPVEIGILAEKDMIDPMTEKLVSTVMEPITLQGIATSSKELTTITKKSMNQIQISKKLHKGHKQTTLHAIMNIQQNRRDLTASIRPLRIYSTYDSDLCDIDNVLSLGFFDLDCGDDSPLLEGKKEDPLEEELLLEKHDLALCTISESNWFPPSGSPEGRCGSSAPPKFGLRMKGI